MKLPGINYGGRPESLGRRNINLPAQQAAASNRALGAAGGLVAAVAIEYDKREKMRQLTSYQTSMVAAEASVWDRINKGASDYTPDELKGLGIDVPAGTDPLEGYKVIAPYYSAAMEKYNQEAMQSVESPALRRKLENEWKVKAAQGTAKAIELQMSRQRDALYGELEVQRKLALDVSDAATADMVIDKQVAAGLIPRSKADGQKRANHFRVETDGYNLQLKDGNIAAMKRSVDLLKAPYKDYQKAGGIMSEENRRKWVDRFEQEMKQLTAVNQTQMLMSMDRAVQAMNAGAQVNVSDSQIAGIVDDRTRENMRRKVLTARQQRDVRQRIRMAPASEILSELTATNIRLQNAQAEGKIEETLALSNQQQALSQAYAARQQQVEADPAGYVISNSPSLQETYQVLKADGPKSDPAVVQQYATEVIGRSHSLGVRQVNLMPNSDIQVFGSAYQNADPEGREVLVSGLREQWTASYWPMVQDQLVRAKVFTGVDEVLAGLTPSQEGVRSYIVAYQQNSDAIRKANSAISPDTTKKEWENLAVQSASELRTSIPQGREADIMPVVQSIEAAARSYHAKNGGTPEDAMSYAKSQIVDNEFTFVENADQPQVTIRIPVTVDPDVVSRGTDEIKARFGYGDTLLRAPDGTNYRNPKLNVQFPGLPSDMTQEVALQQIAEHGYFETKGDNSGLILMWPELNVPVLDASGNRIEYSWSDIEGLAGETFMDTLGRKFGSFLDPGRKNIDAGNMAP